MKDGNDEAVPFGRYFPILEITEGQVERGGPWTVLKLVWNTFAASLKDIEGWVLLSTFVLILLWGTHGALEIPLGWLDGWKGPGSCPTNRDQLIRGVPWDHELISWSAGLILLVGVPAILIKWVYPNGAVGSRLRDYGLRFPPRNRRRFALISAVMLFLVSLVSIYIAVRTTEFQRVYPLFRGDFSGLAQFALYEICYFMFFFAIEFIFRGYLLFGALRARQADPSVELTKASGLPPFAVYAVLISMLSYTAWHLGKPPMEMLSTLLWGFAAGTVVLISRSIWPVIIVHWLLNVVMDFVLWQKWFVEALFTQPG